MLVENPGRACTFELSSPKKINKERRRCAGALWWLGRMYTGWRGLLRRRELEDQGQEVGDRDLPSVPASVSHSSFTRPPFHRCLLGRRLHLEPPRLSRRLLWSKALFPRRWRSHVTPSEGDGKCRAAFRTGPLTGHLGEKVTPLNSPAPAPLPLLPFLPLAVESQSLLSPPRLCERGILQSLGACPAVSYGQLRLRLSSVPDGCDAFQCFLENSSLAPAPLMVSVGAL